MSEASTFRPLKPLLVADPPQPSMSLGERAELCLLPLDRLVVDERYQRAIGRQGRPNVLRILAGFDWRKFTPVVVTPVGDGFFAVIDGQHRATAALMHPSIDMVPCMVIRVSPSEAAACFAAINGVVTKISAGQIWKARVRSGESTAKALNEVLEAAEVRILAHKTPGYEYRKGDTLAVGTLEKAFTTYGGDVLRTALQAVTQTGTGNAGCLVAPMIVAMCEIVTAVPEFLKAPSMLFGLMDEFDLATLIDEARATASRCRRQHARVIREVLADHLSEAVRPATAGAAA